MSDYYTYDKTIKIANNIKNNVEKQKKLGENSQWNYFIAKQIITPKKDVLHWYIKPAPKSIGDNFSSKIPYKDYIDMSKRFVKYVDTNKMLPNYISWNGKKVSVENYTYMFARILVWYANHNNTYPNYVNVDSNIFKTISIPTSSSSSISKKYGHAVKSGCDNMGQNTPYYCACHSMQEVIRNLYNIVIPQKTIASVMGTTTAGTGHAGMNTFVAWFNKKYNKNLKVEWKNFSDLGWNGINNIIKSKNQDCIIHNLYRSKYGHYEVVNGVSSNISVQNSLGSKCGSCYCGYIEYRTQSTFRSYINGISQKSIMVLTRK